MKNTEQALSRVRHEVRAARLRRRRDKRLGLKAPRSLVQMAAIVLPRDDRRYRFARTPRPGVDGEAIDIGVDRRQAEPGQRLDRGIKTSSMQAPDVREPGLGRELKSATAAGEDCTDQLIQPDPEPSAVAPGPLDSAEAAEAGHSGHVTLYLPKDLSRWLTDHHDASGVSYPEIVLNAISWAVEEEMLPEIFARIDSHIPANDIFGRAQMITRPTKGSAEPETRPLRFRTDHMQIIISLARVWTADNRNAFFVGVLAAYRDHRIRRPAD